MRLVLARTARSGVLGRMAITGEYVPSKAQWVRDQVEQFEASNGQEANTLPGTDYPIVVITNVGAKSGYVRKTPLMRVERDGVYVAIASKGGAAGAPGVVLQLRGPPRGRAAGRVARRRPTAPSWSRARSATTCGGCRSTRGRPTRRTRRRPTAQIPVFKLPDRLTPRVEPVGLPRSARDRLAPAPRGG